MRECTRDLVRRPTDKPHDWPVGRTSAVCAFVFALLIALIMLPRNFHVSFAQDSSVVCTAASLEKGDRHPITHIETYTTKGKVGLSLLDWVRRVVDQALENSSDV